MSTKVCDEGMGGRVDFDKRVLNKEIYVFVLLITISVTKVGKRKFESSTLRSTNRCNWTHSRAIRTG